MRSPSYGPQRLYFRNIWNFLLQEHRHSLTPELPISAEEHFQGNNELITVVLLDFLDFSVEELKLNGILLPLIKLVCRFQAGALQNHHPNRPQVILNC